MIIHDIREVRKPGHPYDIAVWEPSHQDARMQPFAAFGETESRLRTIAVGATLPDYFPLQVLGVLRYSTETLKKPRCYDGWFLRSERAKGACIKQLQLAEVAPIVPGYSDVVLVSLLLGGLVRSMQQNGAAEPRIRVDWDNMNDPVRHFLDTSAGMKQLAADPSLTSKKARNYNVSSAAAVVRQNIQGYIG